MSQADKAQEARARRRRRIRAVISGTPERPRLTVFRSSKHIYAQVVDDDSGTTLAAASDVGKVAAKAFASADSKLARAKLVGEAIAKACLAKGITKVVFDRNGYVFRGTDPENPNSKPTRIAAVAEAARAAGLDF